MAKKPNVFENALTKMNQGYGVVPMGGRYGTSDPRGSASVSTGKDPISTKMDSDYSAKGPSFPESAGNIGSLGAADARAAGINPFAGSGIVVDRSPVEDAPGYTSSITSTGNFVIRDASGKVILSNNKYSSAADADAFVAARRAAKEEEVKPTAVEEKTDEITDLATKITTKSSGVSAGPAQDAAEEFKEKGRKSTIMTSAQGITDEPVTGMLGKDGAEADRAKKLRGKRSLLAG